MITTIVQFHLPVSLTLDEAQILFSESAPSFRHITGLIRKYFLFSDNGKAAGGIYLWNSREDAEKFYSTGFRQSITATFGSEPTITYFETPVIVDNALEDFQKTNYLPDIGLSVGAHGDALPT